MRVTRGYTARRMEATLKLVLVVYFLGLLDQTQNQEVSTIRVCEKHEYLDLSTEPATCKNCTVCEDSSPDGEVYTLTNCTARNDTVCSRCEPDLIWSEDLARCVQCGPCCSNSVLDLSCSLQGSDPGASCLFNPDCAGVKAIEPGGGSTREIKPGGLNNLKNETKTVETTTNLDENYTSDSTDPYADTFIDNTIMLKTEDSRETSTTTGPTVYDDKSEFSLDQREETTSSPTVPPPPKAEGVEPWKILAYVGCCTAIGLLVTIMGFCVWRRYKRKQLRRKGVVPDNTMAEEAETTSPAYGLTLEELAIPAEYDEPVYATVGGDDKDNNDDEDKLALPPRVAVLSTKASNKPASYKNKFLDVSMYDKPYAHRPSQPASMRGSHPGPPSEFLQLDELGTRHGPNRVNTNLEQMTEDDLDESFYARGVPLDREYSLGPEAAREYNRRVKRNVPHSYGHSAVYNDCYEGVSTMLDHAASPRDPGTVAGDPSSLHLHGETEMDLYREETYCKCTLSEKLTEPEETDETTAEMQHYIYAHDDYQSYVGFYSRLDTVLRRLNVMMVGYPRAGKTCLVDTLLGKPFRENQCTNGIDLSTCSVTANPVDADELNWSSPGQPFYERINTELRSKFCGQSTTPKDVFPSRDSSDPIRENSLSSLGEHSTQSSISELESEMKVWDMSGEFGFYSTHQMFLSSSSVFLLVMDATKDLDVSLPLSRATRSKTGKIECPKTPREFLDYWLGSIGTFAGHATDGTDIEPHVIIVLTHTDLIDVDGRDHLIQEYKTDVLNHVKMRYTCKYVHHEVFAISNKDRDETVLNSLKRLILELCRSKPSYGIRKPCTWLKLEADIQKFCSEVERKHVQLKSLYQYANRTFGMSFVELKAFLQFHHEYRNLIFTDSGESLSPIDNPYMNVHLSDLTVKSSLIVTDPQYLVDKFRAVITLWQFRETSKLKNKIQRDIDRDFEKGSISMTNLKILWDNADKNEIESLVDIMVKMNLFIRCETSPPDQDSCSKFIVPALLPPSGPSELGSGPYKEMDKLKPLVYVFHQSPDVDGVEGSGFLPVGFFFMLVASLSNWLPQQRQPWKRTKLSYNSASFRAGHYSDVLVNVSCHSYVIVLNVLRLPVDVSRTPDDGSHCVISQIRQRFESAIKMMLKRTSPYLYCSVYVSACPDSTTNFRVSFPCLERLGDLGHVRSPLKVAVCFKHNNHLPIEKFRCWFCARDQSRKGNVSEEQRRDQLIKDQRKLQNYAKKVSNVSTLWSLGLALDLSIEEIEACRTDAATDIEHATLKMLYVWYKKGSGSLESGSSKDVQLTDAMEEAGLGNYV